MEKLLSQQRMLPPLSGKALACSSRILQAKSCGLVRPKILGAGSDDGVFCLYVLTSKCGSNFFFVNDSAAPFKMTSTRCSVERS